MYGAMKNDAFDLRWWSLDQALIWISSRDPDAVMSGSSWVDFRADRIGVWNTETNEHEYEHADPVVHPKSAEQQLLRALQNEQIEGLNGGERLAPIWFDQADYLRNWNETLLVNWYLPAAVRIKDLSGGGQYIQRVNPDENKIPVRVPSAQVLACFPAQEQIAIPQDQQDNSSNVSEQTSPSPDSEAGAPKRRRDYIKGDEQLQRGLRSMGVSISLLRKSNKLPKSARALAKTLLTEDPDLRERVGDVETVRKIIGGTHPRSNRLAEQGLISPWWPVDLPSNGSGGED